MFPHDVLGCVADSLPMMFHKVKLFLPPFTFRLWNWFGAQVVGNLADASVSDDTVSAPEDCNILVSEVSCEAIRCLCVCLAALYHTVVRSCPSSESGQLLQVYIMAGRHRVVEP